MKCKVYRTTFISDIEYGNFENSNCLRKHIFGMLNGVDFMSGIDCQHYDCPPVLHRQALIRIVSQQSQFSQAVLQCFNTTPCLL